MVNGSWFDTITIATPGRTSELTAGAVDRGINLGPVDDGHVRIAFDETTTEEIVVRLLAVFGAAVGRFVLMPTRYPSILSGIRNS